MNFRSKPMGWRNESWRHSLASRGVKTGKKSALHGAVIGHTVHGIPITLKEPPKPGTTFPVSPDDVKEVLSKFSNKALSGVTEISFRNPGPAMTKQDKAWAQYAREDKRFNIFSQQMDEHGRIDGHDAKDLKAYFKRYVIPHEAGHHIMQHTMGLNKDSMLVEEARADAVANGENPMKKDVLKKFINNRKQRFGAKGSI